MSARICVDHRNIDGVVSRVYMLRDFCCAKVLVRKCPRVDYTYWKVTIEINPPTRHVLDLHRVPRIQKVRRSGYNLHHMAERVSGD
jgi:hypothetical protein